MNGPRRLDPATKRPLDEAPTAEGASSPRAPVATSPAKAAAEIKRISQYSWSQTDDQIKICVEPSGWNFATIAAEDVSVELTSPTSLKALLAWKKTKKRLVITLDKQDNVLGWDKEWKELVSDKKMKEKEDEEDADEAD
ncbi:low voltage-gated calcium channel [Aureococcus anophagefferens]|nr:low voltage-gated calcium channel [Aureococcus anophagefferens]